MIGPVSPCNSHRPGLTQFVEDYTCPDHKIKKADKKYDVGSIGDPKVCYLGLKFSNIKIIIISYQSNRMAIYKADSVGKTAL